MIERTLKDWRSLPHLKVREAAAIAGVCERTIEAAMGKMETRTIGRIRFVTTDSFRRWLGEDVPAVKAAETVTREADKWASSRLRRLGMGR